jgi:hypothetical protein
MMAFDEWRRLADGAFLLILASDGFLLMAHSRK